MFSRIVTILLIAAIVGCPLWCASGLFGCCAAEHSPQQVSLVDVSACCQCHDATDGRDQNAPSEIPRRSCEACKGVCGGAVVEKPYQFSGGEDQAFLLSLIADGATEVQLTDCRPCLVVPPVYHGGGNVGRVLRTLHMSYLC